MESSWIEKLEVFVAIVIGSVLFVGLLFLLSKATYFVFGHGIGNFLWETLMVAILAAIIGAIIYLPATVFCRDKERERWASISTIIVFVWIIIPHVLMSIGQRNIKMEFNRVANQGALDSYYQEPTGFFEDSGKTRLDYGGRLTKILQKRDRTLNRWRFKRIGVWSTDGDFNQTSCVYVFIGIQGLNKVDPN